jgi:hypothetical protein
MDTNTDGLDTESARWADLQPIRDDMRGRARSWWANSVGALVDPTGLTRGEGYTRSGMPVVERSAEVS